MANLSRRSSRDRARAHGKQRGVITYLFWPHRYAAASADSPMAKTILGFVSWRGCSGGYAKTSLSARDGGNVIPGQTRSGSFRLAAAGGAPSSVGSGVA